MKKEKPFVERLKEAYDKAKKPLSYIIIFTILLLELASNLDVIPHNIKSKIELSLMIAISMIVIEILFCIYEKVVEDRGHLKVIKPNGLYDEILSLVKTGKNVKIQCISVAGRFGWYSVLSRLLDKGGDDSLHEANNFDIEVALISPKYFEENKAMLEKFDAVFPVIQDINRTQKQLKTLYPDDNKKISLFHYDYLPNFVGFLVNDNYLFLNVCYWDEADNNELIFRAGGTEYLVYDKNDEFGGSRYIERFSGWFNYIKRNHINNTKNTE